MHPNAANHKKNTKLRYSEWTFLGVTQPALSHLGALPLKAGTACGCLA